MLIISNAAGVLTTTQDLFWWTKFATQHFPQQEIWAVSKTATWNPIEYDPSKNNGRRKWLTSLEQNPQKMINRIGLINRGTLAHIRQLEKVKAHDPEVKTVLSLFPDSNFPRSLEAASNSRFIDKIEINVGCPNHLCQGQVPGYHPQTLRNILALIKRLKIQKPIILKLPYYPSLGLAIQAAKIIQKFKPEYIICCNTLTGYVPGFGFGGISGDITPMALANIIWFSRLLPTQNIIGCGGFTPFETITNQLKGFQFGTSLLLLKSKERKNQKRKNQKIKAKL